MRKNNATHLLFQPTGVNSAWFLPRLTKVTFGGLSSEESFRKLSNWGKILSACLVFGLLFYFIPSAWAWWDPNWQYRKRLTFHNSGQNEALVSFTVLVRLTSSNFDFSKAKTNGEDIRFVDSDDFTELKYEIERWDSGSSVAEAWVRVPQIDANSDTDYIWMYYGKSDAIDGQDITNTWRSEWTTVTHLAKTGDDFDSISGTNAYVQTGTVQSVAGKIGLARNSDNGDSNYLLRAPFPDPTTITVMAWVNFDSTPVNWSRPFSREPSGKAGQDWQHGRSVSGLRWWDGSQLDTIGLTIVNDAWYFIVTTNDGSTGRIYIDGNQNTSGSQTHKDCSANPLYLFRSGKGDGRYMVGMIDEFRMYAGELSAAWIAAEYLSMTDQFISYGTEEIGDTTPPISSVDALPTFTNTLSFTVSWSGSDNGGSGIKHYDVQVKDGSGGTWTNWITQTTDTSATYTGEDGHTYYFQCRAEDNAGNWEPYPGGEGDTHTTVDTTAPTGVISINNGAAFTSSRNVTLNLSATNASQMCFSNDNSSWSDWENYATEKSWTLTSGDGTKTVYVRFKDSVGNVSETYSDTIELDTTPPTTGSVSINNGAPYTNRRAVTLELSASDSPSSGISEMMISDSSSFEGSSWEDYATSKSWTLPSGDGKNKVYVKFKDGAGNVSEIYSDEITLDTIPPTVSITSPSADTSVRGSVVVKGTASDENLREYKVEYGQGTQSSSWTEITSSTSQVTNDTLATWDATALNDGSYTLRLTAEDLAGNSAQTQVSLCVDNHPPEATLIDYPPDTVTGNTPKVVVTFTWTGYDPDGITPVEKLVFQYQLEGHPDYQDWSGWSSETTKTYVLSSGNYTFKVRAKDEAGNYPAEDDSATAKSSFTVSLPIIISPNPCYPDQGQIVTIPNLPLASNLKIQIYDLGGNLIRTLGETEAHIEGGSKTANWDCRNSNGELVTRGVYIYFIPGASEKKSGKIAIIR